MRPTPFFFLLFSAGVLLHHLAAAQGLTGALIGSVKDEQGSVLPGAVVRVTSPALIRRQLTMATNGKGQLRFPVLAPGSYTLDIEAVGFAKYHEEDIAIGAGATIERTVVLRLAGIVESVTVQGGSRIEARSSGFETRFGYEDLKTIPTGRFSMFDFIRAAPGISPTSPASGTTTSVSATSVSALGSGVNENQFLIDGTNFTCPCSGLARSEPGVDFIQEVQVQTVGASAEFGNMQGAVINVITRQGGERLLFDASIYGQPASLTSQPVMLPVTGGSQPTSGYTRTKYHDFTTNVGGPVVRDRLWFFGGYQNLRDYDSQPGVEPKFPRTYEQDKLFGKLTWRFTPNLQLMQSVHQELWVNPPPPTLVIPFEATTRNHASVPAITFGHLTHTLSVNTVWDARVGRFVVSEKRPPSTGTLTTANHTDRVTRVQTGGPQTFGERDYYRTTAKATLSHYQTGLAGADHQWKLGGSIERGEAQHTTIIPTGVRFSDNPNGQPFQSISADPSPDGGLSITASAFLSDAITIGDRLTLNAGVRFDHSRAISEDLHALDLQGHKTEAIVAGLGTLYTWNIVSPRLGVTTKLTADGRTILRASYGRFSQGVLTGEFGTFHPGVPVVTTAAFNAATGGYTTIVSVVDPKTQLQLDPEIRAPRTDEYSVGVDREVGRQLTATVAYVRKNGANFIGYTDVGGQYSQQTRPLPDGNNVPVLVLLNSTSARRFLLTNPDEFSMTYNGFVTVLEKRQSHGWRAFGSYTFSRAEGLQVSSGTAAAGEQLSTLTSTGTFGRDPNNFTNARGRLANDRPHIFRVMGSVEVPRTGFMVAANLQHFSGKPWAATTQVALPQGDQRILLEAPGSRRLSSQSLLDLRLSRTFHFGSVGRLELLMDVLNLLNDTAEEAIATDNIFSATFGQPTVFMNPRHVMLGARLNLGR
jgi:TonB dependent receptor-like, beta-barrel/Carboxypeptidase regulatory-like domain